jgi:hypothetical protein
MWFTISSSITAIFLFGRFHGDQWMSRKISFKFGFVKIVHISLIIVGCKLVTTTLLSTGLFIIKSPSFSKLKMEENSENEQPQLDEQEQQEQYGNTMEQQQPQQQISVKILVLGPPRVGE